MKGEMKSKQSIYGTEYRSRAEAGVSCVACTGSSAVAAVGVVYSLRRGGIPDWRQNVHEMQQESGECKEELKWIGKEKRRIN